MSLQEDIIGAMRRGDDPTLSYARRDDAPGRSRMGLRVVVWTVLAVVLLLGATYAIDWERGRREYFRLFDPNIVIGMTPAQVTARLGPPQFGSGATEEWVYQAGMDPAATIRFRNGVVVGVERHLYGGAP